MPDSMSEPILLRCQAWPPCSCEHIVPGLAVQSCTAGATCTISEPHYVTVATGSMKVE